MRAIDGAATPAEARVKLEQIISQPGHTFWPDDLSITDVAHIPWTNVAGHRQVTDGYLLGLAIHHGGRLATFDTGILLLDQQKDKTSANVVLIPK